MVMLAELQRDLARYAEYGEAWWLHAGFWVTAVYRLGAWARSLPGVFRIPVGLVYRMLKLPFLIFRNVEIPASAAIGGGLCLIHPNNILIGSGVIIGEDCLIFHEVTLGTGATPGLPRIGDRVQIFVGARVLGPVVVGAGTRIGANCVVTRSVAPDSVILPALNRVIPLSRLATLNTPPAEPPTVSAPPGSDVAPPGDTRPS
jgi:serine O-acetyltransferase